MKKTVVLASMLSVAVVRGLLGVIHAASKDTDRVDAATQTKEVARGATAFLETLSAEQRQQATFDFAPQKSAVIARFHRTPDGGVASGAPSAISRAKGPGGPPQGNPPVGDHRMGSPNGGPPGADPGGPGFGQGPPGGFVGEQYGNAVGSNYPVSDVLRPGLRLGVLNDTQKAAVMHLLQTMLRPMGYQKVLDIMGSD